jgi:hypothetical protein
MLAVNVQNSGQLVREKCLNRLFCFDCHLYCLPTFVDDEIYSRKRGKFSMFTVK